MKKTIIFNILIIISILQFACVKEQDISTTTTTISEPQTGDTHSISGLVRDSSGQVLPNVSVKFHLDDLELETKTDVDGVYDFLIPSIKTEGYIIADDESYSKSIVYFNELSDATLSPIYLVEEAEASTLDLDLKVDQLLKVKGRIVDQFSDPVQDARVFVYSLANPPNQEFIIHGFVLTNAAGQFELYYEEGNYFTTILRGAFPTPCAENIGINWQNPDAITDLGDIIMQIDDYSRISADIIIDDVDQDVSAVFYDVNDLQNNVYNHLGGEVSLDVCDGAEEIEVVYIGVANDDLTKFEGNFVPVDELNTYYYFPFPSVVDENYVIVSTEAQNMIFAGNNTFIYNAENSIISHPDNPNLLTFNFRTTDSYSVDGRLVLELGEMDFFSFQKDGVTYTLYQGAKNYINFIPNEIGKIAAIISGKALGDDGNIIDFKIKFRVDQ